MRGSLRTDARSSIGRILAAARRLLGEPTAASLNRIAQEAGVGIATLYRHFPNRQVLARAVLEQVFDEEVEPLLARFAEGDAPRADLLAVAERLVDLLHRERGVVASIGNPTDVTAHFLARDRRLADAVARARLAGNLRPDLDADDLPALLAMLVTGPGLLDAEPTSRRRYLSLLLDGLNPGRAEPLPPRPPVGPGRP
ncbi:MAG: helix-turn-helix domain-containing protein [Propionicimonas sp.]|nr:helix-turn-helix domain-containing protein [Propionicimonas sp.]